MFQVLQCTFLTFDYFQGFSPLSRSFHESFSLSWFVSFLTIFQVLQCVCLIFHIFQFSRHMPGPIVYISHFSSFSCLSPYSRSNNMSFSFSLLVRFLTTFQVLQCAFLIFHVFQFFSPLFRLYRVCVSFSIFSGFSMFLAIF